MPALNRQDQRGVDELKSELRTLVDGEGPVLPRFVGDLRELMHTEQMHANRIQRSGGPASVDFFYHAGDGAAAVANRWHDAVSTMYSDPSRSTYDPRRPELAQRNVVVDEVDLRRIATRTPTEAYFRLFIPLKGGELHQLRVLVCEGEHLLAWVGGYQPEPFNPRQKSILRALVPAIRRRLLFERLLELGETALASTDALLENVAGAAFLLTPSGAIAHANAAGLQRLSHDSSLWKTLRELIRKPPLGWRVSPIVAKGQAQLFLAIQRNPPASDAMVAQAAKTWNLTRRQAAVLALLVQGQANKTIASTLDCAERTVEFHLTAILVKAAVDSRAALIARFFTGSC
jgi:DNA-binding CsgD family transcriptional regulator